MKELNMNELEMVAGGEGILDGILNATSDTYNEAINVGNQALKETDIFVAVSTQNLQTVFGGDI
ncbi:hypothetical protein [Serratia sp. M24T3]|uniref:hypothetical protein n=1 Tax=Serratia sp. M24T3 TaxID=932213 RepID=UPI00025BB93D|nr:hypothetical protein [Serratia sp. M24T3]EIC85040.1 hypothetical protein SPM24T3_08179 [Serratia sp. M24T3]